MGAEASATDKTNESAANGAVLCIAAVLIIAIAAGYSIHMTDKRLTVNEATYQPLLQVIADAESKGNYNAYFGHANNTAVNFTNMSIAQVLQWQKQYVQQGSPSSAVGRYQFLNTTLQGLVNSQNIDDDQPFNEAMQDKLATVLLDCRGGEAYVNHELSGQQFAANIAKEWASMPKIIGDNPQASYYAGDGLNKALVAPETVLQAVAQVNAK